VAELYELNITFAGIITHLDGIVPGVPMRAVVPNALSVRFGEIWIPDPLTLQLRRKEYYLMPHLAYISDAGGSTSQPCGLPQVVDGRYLKIVNATGDPLHFANKEGFSLREFVYDLQLDDDVVFGGNAACYFDIFHGCAWSEGTGNEPRTTRVRMETVGLPRLGIAAMPGSGPDVCGDCEIEIQPNAAGVYELFVTNLDYDPATEYRNFDFLMNYLVAKGGIPRVLKKPTPGMPPDPDELTMRYLGEKLKALGEFIRTEGGTVGGYSVAGGGIKVEGVSTNPAPSKARHSSLAERLTAGVQAPVPLDQSCSDSHFP
jgi:hypothetical protein